MGELILCRQQIAALPYYIEAVSLNVYSLEELSYYIENNLYLMEQDFMDEELCAWVANELKMKETAEQLREIKEAGGTLSEFVICLLSASGYCSLSALKNIRQTLQEMEHKTDFECGKIRADRYMENQKYICAVYEYRKLLRQETEEKGEDERENPVLLGNVWHNLGTAYARMFLFERAANSYSRAYELNQNPKSLKACLFAYRCRKDERGFQRKAAAGFLTEEEMGQIAASLSEMSRMEKITQFEDEIDRIFTEEAWQETTEKLLEEWKEEYRKNSKI